jgi:hypothetical protein
MAPTLCLFNELNFVMQKRKKLNQAVRILGSKLSRDAFWLTRPQFQINYHGEQAIGPNTKGRKEDMQLNETTTFSS